MSDFQIGDIKITRVVESRVTWPAKWILKDIRPEDMLKDAAHMPAGTFSADGKLITLSIHSLIVESAGVRILVDTCVGDDKPREVPEWNQKHCSYLADLAQAGYPRESIDRVLCTHFHLDHAGWNTMLKDGKWLPTFPNARYLLDRVEYDHWCNHGEHMDKQIIADSVQPVVDAGIVDWLKGAETIAPGVTLQQTPGHTPGHLAVKLESRGHHAVITGDLIHHPFQCLHPDWEMRFDSDPEQGCRTRRAFLQQCAEHKATVFGTHFSAESGRVERHGETFKFEV